MGRFRTGLCLAAFSYPAFVLATFNLTVAPALFFPFGGETFWERIDVSVSGVYGRMMMFAPSSLGIILVLTLALAALLSRCHKGLAGLVLVAHGGWIAWNSAQVLTRFGRRGWLVALAGVVGLIAVAAGLRWIKQSQIGHWRLGTMGLVLSVAMASGLYAGGKTIETSRREASRRILDSLHKTDPATPYESQFFQKGVSFTAERGVRYGADASREMLRKLQDHGVNSIALVPYGMSRGAEIRTAGERSWESDTGIVILAADAHQLGIKVLLKPHVWRVSQDQLNTEDLRRRWFDQYGLFLEHYERLAAQVHVDMFCIGVEFGWLTKDEPAWRNLIARVRRIYKGPLVYAANFGEEFERVGFWDALDYIGLDNYYPLPDDYSTAELLKKVETVQRRFNKPVIFTEAGYSSVVNARKTPWADETGHQISLEEQARCYEALLAAFYDKPWFHGVYWWKVGTNGYGGPENGSMTPWRKPAMEVAKKYYLSGRR